MGGDGTGRLSGFGEGVVKYGAMKNGCECGGPRGRGRREETSWMVLREVEKGWYLTWLIKRVGFGDLQILEILVDLGMGDWNIEGVRGIQ